MRFAPRIEMRFRHEFYGRAEVPVSVRPADPAGFQRTGLISREDGGVWRVIGDPDAQAGVVSFDVVAEDEALVTVTEGVSWASVPVFVISGPGDVDLSATKPDKVEPRMVLGRLNGMLARLKISVPGPGEQPTKLNLRWGSVRGIWTYRVVARDLPEGLSVTDAEGEVEFVPAGDEVLPDGRAVKLFRSSKGVPAAMRAPQRFSLNRVGPFGDPETLIEILPVAGSDLTEAPKGTKEATHISDIYVTL